MGLEWLACINGGSSSIYYAEAMKGQFTLSRDNAKYSLYLEMSSLESEDTIVYYSAKHTVTTTVGSDTNQLAGYKGPAGGAKNTKSSGSQKSLLREA